jgi:hypothetical protein
MVEAQLPPSAGADTPRRRESPADALSFPAWAGGTRSTGGSCVSPPFFCHCGEGRNRVHEISLRNECDEGAEGFKDPIPAVAGMTKKRGIARMLRAYAVRPYDGS